MSLFSDITLPGATDWVRHAHQTVSEFLKQQLRVNGWSDVPTAQRNFGIGQIYFEDVNPEAPEDLKPNTISIDIGDVPAQDLEQLGGGLYSLSIPIFVDIYGERISVSMSIADDVRRLLTDRAIELYDFTDPAAPVQMDGAYIEFEQVIGPRRPAAAGVSLDLLRHWRIVRATAKCYFTAEF